MPQSVLITRNLLSDGAELLRSHGLTVEINNLNRAYSARELTEKASAFDALICTLDDKIDSDFLAKNSHLKVIANYAVGHNNIDLRKARELGIRISNTPDVLTEATAEMALGLILAAMRNFQEGSFDVRNGGWSSWSPMGYLGWSLRGKTLGIVGLGRIGMRLAEMCASAFSMTVIYCGPHEKENSLGAQKVEFHELLAKSDVISLHLPLTAETKHLIGQKELALMKKSAVLVNTARGDIVEQAALIEALKKKSIFAAGLDVTTPEPLPLSSELLKLKNCFLLPHIGSATFEARTAMSLLCAENVLLGLQGKALKTEVHLLR